jgi:hypothetical protein
MNPVPLNLSLSKDAHRARVVRQAQQERMLIGNGYER